MFLSLHPYDSDEGEFDDSDSDQYGSELGSDEDRVGREGCKLDPGLKSTRQAPGFTKFDCEKGCNSAFILNHLCVF